MTIYLRDVADGIRDTALLADPDNLEGWSYLKMEPHPPAILVVPELEPLAGRRTMDSQQFQFWRIWVVVARGDDEEAVYKLYDLIDDVGENSIPAQFTKPDAPWRSVEGLAEVSWYGFARVPSDIQGPLWVSFGGADYYGAALLIQVRYGN